MARGKKKIAIIDTDPSSYTADELAAIASIAATARRRATVAKKTPEQLSESAKPGGHAAAKKLGKDGRRRRASKGGKAVQSKLTTEERSRRAKLRWARYRAARDGKPAAEPE